MMMIVNNRSPLVIAHRGCATRSTENTFGAFRDAWLLGADAIETDVRWTKDKIFVLHHDSYVVVGGEEILISDLIYSKLCEKIKCRFPTILDVLRATRCHANELNILFLEIKSDDPAVNTIDLALKCICKIPSSFPVRVVITSNNLQVVRAVAKEIERRSMSDKIDVGYTVHSFREFLFARSFQNRFPGRFISMSRSHRLAFMFTFRKSALIYTVNSCTEALKLFNAGVVGIFTDNLGPMIDVRDKWLRKKQSGSC